MSLREIDISLRKINVRTHNNFAMKASLYGVKIPIKETGPKKKTALIDKDPKKAEKATSATEQAIARMKLTKRPGKK